MDLLIRLLVVSFPFVFAATLLWPTIEDRFLPQPAASIVEDSSPDIPPIIQRYNPSTSRKVVRSESSEKVSVPDQSGIYRWVDENGRVVFSDRPNHREAVPHTPIDIGYVHVSDEVKVRNLKNQFQLAKIKKDIVSKPARSRTVKVVSRAVAADYKFSNTGAGQKHGYVLFSGRISNGPACKQLKVVASAKSDMGDFVQGRDETRFNGFGSTIFEMKPKVRWNGKGRRPQWEITNVSARCVSQ